VSKRASRSGRSNAVRSASVPVERSLPPARNGALPAALVALLVIALCAFFAGPAFAAGPLTIEHIVPEETGIEVSGTFEVQDAEAGQIYLQASTDEINWNHSVTVGGFGEGETGTIVPFAGTVEGLEPSTPYFLRIETQNNNGSVKHTYPGKPYPTATTTAATAVPPVIEKEATTSITSTGATLSAYINPKRFATTYTFEYALKSVIESPQMWSSPEVHRSEATQLPEINNVGQPVSYRVTGISPGDVYVWRVSAENEGGTTVGGEKTFTAQHAAAGPTGGCPNQQFRSGIASYLPDCRAYEQATPTDKEGIDVQGLPDWFVAGADPTNPRVAFINYSGNGIPGAGGGRQDFTPMLSSLADGSWSTASLFPPETPRARFASFLGLSGNLRFALAEVKDNPNRGTSNVGIVGLDLIDTVTDTVTPIVTSGEKASFAFHGDAVAGDGSYVIFESELPVAPGAAPGVNNLYRWDRTTNLVTTVGIVPTGAGERAPALGSFGGAYEWLGEFGPNTEDGGASANQYVEAIHAIGPGGRQIYFTEGSTGRLFLRRGLDGTTPATVEASKPNEGVTDPYVEEELFGERLPAAFQEATPDGTLAFFTSREKLTADAATGPFDGGTDLYRFDAATDSLVDITGGLETSGDPDGAHVIGLLGTSADGSSGYFAAESAIGIGGTAGQPNIYRFEEDGSGGFQFSFVATLQAGDTGNWAIKTYAGQPSPNTFAGKTSRVSPDGKTLLFTSKASLNNYDNRGCGTGGEHTNPCQELFLYSVARGGPVCISCNPTGETVRGDSGLASTGLNVSFQTPSGNNPIDQLTRNLSSDGDRVFFQTPDSLVPEDENGQDCRYLRHTEVGALALPSCLDVYEWEAPGTPGGTCTKVEVNGGCLYLLSSGDSADASDFVDASADGSNAFIATSSQLVPTDRDQLYDLYDVHADGGLATQFVEPTSPCEAEGCRSTSIQAPDPASPGTASFAGPSNEKPQTCHKSKKHCKKSPAKKHRRHGKKHRKHGDNVKKRHAGGHSHSSKGGHK
jgi:hypothetical protein